MVYELLNDNGVIVVDNGAGRLAYGRDGTRIVCYRLEVPVTLPTMNYVKTWWEEWII